MHLLEDADYYILDDTEVLQSLLMLVAIFFMRLMEIMFFVGIAGSAIVVVISFIEDLQLLVGE